MRDARIRPELHGLMPGGNPIDRSDGLTARSWPTRAAASRRSPDRCGARRGRRCCSRLGCHWPSAGKSRLPAVRMPAGGRAIGQRREQDGWRPSSSACGAGDGRPARGRGAEGSRLPDRGVSAAQARATLSTAVTCRRFRPPEPGPDPGPKRRGASSAAATPSCATSGSSSSAHYDHLGVRGGVLYPGADDNASGVAMMLEVARSMAAAPQAPGRSLMFIGFDLEEIGLFGSRYFVAHPPVPLEQVALFITADMIGRSLAGSATTRSSCWEPSTCPACVPGSTRRPRDQPLKVGLLGSDVLVLNRSDYGPFRTRHVPYLFFSTGENPRYHSPDDRPETLDYPKLTAISRVIHRVAATVADAPEVPRWSGAARSSAGRGHDAPRRDAQAPREPRDPQARRRRSSS